MNRDYVTILAKSVGGVFSAISWIFFMSVYIFFKAEKIFQEEEWIKLLTYLLFIVIPMVTFITMSQLGIIDDMDTRDKKKRILLVSTFIFFSLALIIVAIRYNFVDLAKLTFVFVFPAIIVGIINKFWLLSVHTSSNATAITTLVYLSGWPFHLLYIILVLVAWSRVHEGKHTPGQVTAGAAMGILVAFMLLFLLFPPLYFS